MTSSIAHRTPSPSRGQSRDSAATARGRRACRIPRRVLSGMVARSPQAGRAAPQSRGEALDEPEGDREEPGRELVHVEAFVVGACLGAGGWGRRCCAGRVGDEDRARGDADGTETSKKNDVPLVPRTCPPIRDRPRARPAVYAPARIPSSGFDARGRGRTAYTRTDHEGTGRCARLLPPRPRSRLVTSAFSVRTRVSNLSRSGSRRSDIGARSPSRPARTTAIGGMLQPGRLRCPDSRSPSSVSDLSPRAVLRLTLLSGGPLFTQSLCVVGRITGNAVEARNG